LVADSAELHAVALQDNGAELRNPGMGWVLHYYDNVPTNYGSRLEPSDTLAEWPGLGASYLRIPWAWIEPTEGELRWSVLDTPLRRYADLGLPAGIRISCSESWTEYGTPEWVRLAGAKGYRFRPGKGIEEDGPFWEPDYDDPVFMAKLDTFVRALAARYDGNPDVAFVDVGSFGVWGEGHTWSSTRKAYPVDTVKRHARLWCKYFRRTPVLAIDDFLSRPGTRPVLKPGLQRSSFDMVVPVAWRGREFIIRAGLWQRGFSGHKGRRKPLADDDGSTTHLARLRIADDGTPTATALDRPFPDSLPEGVDVALRFVGIRYDAVQQPNSLKLDVDVRVAEGIPPDAGIFMHLLDAKTGKEVFVPRSEREDAALTQWLVDQGVGLRDDSILVQGAAAAYFHAGMAQQFWPTAPIVLECEHYGPSKGRGNWGDGSGFLQAVEDYHASYASIHWWPHEFLVANRDLVRQINQRIGYRFVPGKVAWTDKLPLAGRFAVQWQWRNAGVAPPYRSLFPTVTLKDAKGGIVAVFVDEGLDLRALPVQARGQAAGTASGFEQALPFQMTGGTYGVFLSVGDRLGKPIVALPLENGDGTRRYRVGTCAVQGDYTVELVDARLQGTELQATLRWQPHRELPATATPFLHLDQSGKIALAQGVPDSVDVPDLRAGKEQTITHTMVLPDGAKSPLRLCVGLWCPDRMGKGDERLRPDQGMGDRRVAMGILEKVDGAWVFRAGEEQR
jgi:hypothetical protein